MRSWQEVLPPGNSGTSAITAHVGGSWHLDNHLDNTDPVHTAGVVVDQERAAVDHRRARGSPGAIIRSLLGSRPAEWGSDC
jgi:hypothetical protein